MSQKFTPRQLGIVLTIAAVQFVNILDFVIVQPLGPWFAKAVQVSEEHLGEVAGSYTAAAAVAGLLGSFFLDRFDRRKALAVCLLGLSVGTAGAGLATGLRSLLFARVIAGLFGGPATSLAFSIIADVIPNELRGRAMGTVMGAFSVASVLGVPAGLWLAELFDWRAPFFGVAALGLCINVAAIALLPPMRGHLGRAVTPVPLLDILRRPPVQLSYLMTAVVMAAGFSVIPNIAAFLQLNLLFPSDHVKFAYMFGGIASFFATQLGGRLVDRFGSFRVGTFGAAAVLVVVGSMYLPRWDSLPPAVVYVFFVGFMLANGVRNVSYNTLTTKVPEPAWRARFQSLQSAVQHGASALASIGASQLLTREPRPDGLGMRLVHMDTVASLSMGLTLTIPVLLLAVERRVKAQAGTPAVGAAIAAATPTVAEAGKQA